MRLVAKTMEKVVLEITIIEIEQRGFDYHWDKIRRTYKTTDYDVHSISSHDDEDIIFIELIAKRLQEED